MYTMLHNLDNECVPGNCQNYCALRTKFGGGSSTWRAHTVFLVTEKLRRAFALAAYHCSIGKPTVPENMRVTLTSSSSDSTHTSLFAILQQKSCTLAISAKLRPF